MIYASDCNFCSPNFLLRKDTSDSSQPSFTVRNIYKVKTRIIDKMEAKGKVGPCLFSRYLKDASIKI
jgi:hypothetical protein